jgi:DNA-binding NarL/FixJ family response regulator
MRSVLAPRQGEGYGSAPLIRNKRLLILSNTDLFTECLQQALSANFLEYEIKNFGTMRDLEATPLNNVRLVLLYFVSDFNLQHTCDHLHKRYPSASICVVVEKLDDCVPTVATLIENQTIQGILPLDLRLDLFIAAIELMTKGGEHFPSALLRNLKMDYGGVGHTTARMATERRSFQKRDSGEVNLTTREVEILDLVCQGIQNKNIAAELGLSENTVKVHIRNIYKKMKVSNRTEAAALYFSFGNVFGGNPKQI